MAQEIKLFKSKIMTKVYNHMSNHSDEYFSTIKLVEQGIAINIRQARYVCNLLFELQLVRKIPDMNDCRSYLYAIKQ